MNDQLWIDHKGTGQPRAELFNAPRNRDIGGWCKPAYGSGMWTSSADDLENGWVGWMLGDQWVPNGVAGAWILTPASDARIHVIETYADLEAIVERFPAQRYRYLPDLGLGDRIIDFEAAARELDAIHLTASGQWATRLSMPLSLYGWDCESTLWLRWSFSAVGPGPLEVVEQLREIKTVCQEAMG